MGGKGSILIISSPVDVDLLLLALSENVVSVAQCALHGVCGNV